MYLKVIKPLFDFFGALAALIVLAPVFLIVAISVRIDSPGPIFFRQKRLGKNGRVFRIFKFRSMVVNDGRTIGGVLLASDPRITKVGAFLRKTSLDEIPQLINILIGDMSFIGPRPPMELNPKKYEDYNEFEKKRFWVKPGISGLAAVRCREIHDWNINIPIDVEYVENAGAKMDFDLFMKSLGMFFKTDNIYTPGSQDTHGKK